MTEPLSGRLVCGATRPGHPGDFCVRPWGHEGRHWTGRPNPLNPKAVEDMRLADLAHDQENR